MAWNWFKMPKKMTIWAVFICIFPRNENESVENHLLRITHPQIEETIKNVSINLSSRSVCCFCRKNHYRSWWFIWEKKWANKHWNCLQIIKELHDFAERFATNLRSNCSDFERLLWTWRNSFVNSLLINVDWLRQQN